MSLKQAFASWLYNLVMEQHKTASYTPCVWCREPLLNGSAFCSACGWQQQARTGPIQRLPLQLPAAATQVSAAALRLPPQQRTEELQRMAETPTKLVQAVKPDMWIESTSRPKPQMGVDLIFSDGTQAKPEPVKPYPGQRLASYNRQHRREGK